MVTGCKAADAVAEDKEDGENEREKDLQFLMDGDFLGDEDEDTILTT